jgi:hypothetical protein
MLPIRILPVSATLSTAGCTAGKLGLILPIRTLAQSSVFRVGIAIDSHIVASVFFIEASCGARAWIGVDATAVGRDSRPRVKPMWFASPEISPRGMEGFISRKNCARINFE